MTSASNAMASTPEPTNMDELHALTAEQRSAFVLSHLRALLLQAQLQQHETPRRIALIAAYTDASNWHLLAIAHSEAFKETLATLTTQITNTAGLHT